MLSRRFDSNLGTKRVRQLIHFSLYPRWPCAQMRSKMGGYVSTIPYVLTYHSIQTLFLVPQLVELLKATIARLRDAAQAGGAGSSGSLEWPDYMTPCLLLLDLLMKPSSMSNGAELQQADQRGHGATPAGAGPQAPSSSGILAHELTAQGGARDGRGAEAKEWKGSGMSWTRSLAREKLGDRETPS